MIFGAREAGLISYFYLDGYLGGGATGRQLVADFRHEFRVDLIDELFDRSSTRFVDVDREVALAARRIANRYGIGTMDAIQVASAEAAGATSCLSGINA